MPVVKLYHPALGDAQTFEADALSVPHHKRAGWLVVGEQPDAPAPAATSSRRKSEDK